MYQRRISINEKIATNLKHVAAEKKISENATIEKAIAFYCEYYYCKNEAMFLNDNLLQVIKSMTDNLDHRINSRSNQLLSELAIQLGIMQQVIANNLEVDGSQIAEYRKNTVDFIKTNQRIFRMDEII